MSVFTGSVHTPPVFYFFKKKTAALIFQNRRWNMSNERTRPTCPATVFFFPRRARQAVVVHYRKEPTTTRGSLVCYRLCVYASGSLITDRLNCFTLIKFSCLHFGQNNGKLISSVSDLILIRVLFPQTGQ